MEAVMFTKNNSNSRSKMLPALALAAIIFLGAFFRFYQLGAAGVGNEYYAAAVKSMLTSWRNFFFVAFEPGGSVSVDKPPLGFWLEAVSAYFLGVTGFALALPNALAGTLAIPLLYSMVKKQFGLLAGLAAALVLATLPVTIAAERNNTIDGMLVFVLLLAAWAVWQAVTSGQFRFLLLGALLVGLGFNIKMLQATMVLPALYALYFFGAKHSWGKRILHLGLATGLLLVVSLAWVFIVDATPADSRPFVGSSTDNTVTELIVGHNGIRRLVGGGPSGGAGDGQTAANPQPGEGGNRRNPALGFAPPADGGQRSGLSGGQNQGLPGQPPQPRAGANPNNRPGGQNEVGTAGPLRLFTEPLASQASWLLPLALLGSVLTLVSLGRPWPLTQKHLALLLWLGWLLPMVLYFSFTSGLWHTYYLIMLGPALAALVGATVWAFEQLLAQRNRFGWGLIALFSGLTLGFEIFILSAYPVYFALASIWMGVLWLAGLALLWLGPRNWALALLLVSLLVGPLLWSGLTTLTNTEANLPKAGPQVGQPRSVAAGSLDPAQQELLDYLVAHTAPGSYLAATFDSHSAAPLILATGRPVLTFGGFNGSDEVVTLADLQGKVASGDLRFVLDDGSLNRKAEIFQWVSGTCQVVQLPGLTSNTQTARQPSQGGPGGQQSQTLYACGG
jgi:4-amino-4-deoxy-L-arabinose transferase-like glycosyltransferase